MSHEEECCLKDSEDASAFSDTSNSLDNEPCAEAAATTRTPHHAATTTTTTTTTTTANGNGCGCGGGAGPARNFYRGTLRIELPYAGSPPCTSPASPAEVTPTTTTTAAQTPHTAIYHKSDSVVFQREVEECTPISVVEQNARQSALAFLSADISSRAHLGQSVNRGSSNNNTNFAGSTRVLSQSMSNAVSGSFEMADVAAPAVATAAADVPPPKKKAPLQQFFNPRTRKQRSTLSTSSVVPGLNNSNSCSNSGAGNQTNANSSGIQNTAGYPHHPNHNNYNNNTTTSTHAREISTALDLTSGADVESPQRSPGVAPGLQQDSHTSNGGPNFELSSHAASLQQPPTPRHLLGSQSSIERLHGSASPVASPPPPPPPPPLAADEDGEDSSSSGGPGIGMEAVLRDASKIRGIRLTWLLYLLIVMVIVMFTLLLIQIIYESNRTLVRTATQAVRAQASSLLNSIDMEEYALTNVFMLLRDTDIGSVDPSSHTYHVVRENFCSRLYGAPMAFAMYNSSGFPLWRMRCRDYPLSKGYRRLPKKVVPGIPGVRITEYAWDATLAIATIYPDENDNTTSDTYVMLMDKDTVGRTLMGNSFPQYSSATLQYVTSAFLTRVWNSTETRLMFHTLTQSKTTYTATENGTVKDGLMALYDKICYEGSPYIWHTVSDYDRPEDSDSSDSVIPEDEGGTPTRPSRWADTTTNPIPSPHLEYGRAWSQLSVANLCGVQCYGKPGDTTCASDNPTNIWFVVEYSLMKQNGLASILNVVGAVSIVALVVFSFVMFLVYISITVPVNFLRVQLLKAVGANDTQTHCQRKIVGWTYRLWLGDLTAIVRSTHILSLCFRLNKKYVPDHVLRNHAQQLYLRRRTFNFLDDVDLKEDQDDREGSESESDLEPPLPPLAGVSAVIPPQENRFLWHFAAPSDVEEAVHHSTDADGFVISNSGSQESPAGVAAAAAAVANANANSMMESSVLVRKRKSMMRVATYANDSNGAWPIGELDTMGNEPDTSIMMTAAAAANLVQRSLNAMTIRREFESTILCVRIPSVELAYLLNYSAAVVQHRRVMRILLHRIRRHKGALFHRAGDCLAAVWNAFEGCPNHAETAAICAQEIANAFAPFRVDGMHVGLVLHQGLLVCGTVEYSKAAFVTAFGDGPREAFAIAELAATVGSLNIIVTEPVKQSLSGLYDCNIVDVVQLPNSAHPLLLFELGGTRSPFLAPDDAAPLRVQFAVEYARAFAQFRNHEFSESLRTIEHIRLSSSGACNEHLLRRLEKMCFYYATKPTTLPFPYTRPYPVWMNYEAIAQAGLKNDAHFHALRNNSLLSHSFMEGVVYKGVPTVRNEVEYIRDFKQELQENMRRTARKGNGGHPNNNNGGGGSPTLDTSSTRPHITPQSSPPMRPTADPTMMSERVLSVGSGVEMLDHSSTASPRTRHADPNDWRSSMELPAPVVASMTAVPPLSSLSAGAGGASPSASGPAGMTTAAADPSAAADAALAGVGPLSSFATQASLCEDGEHASVIGSSVHTMDSPRDVFALSNRFAMTHRVTNRPPVALAAASPDVPDLTAERMVGATLTHANSLQSFDPILTSNSLIQSAGLSFRNSTNNDHISTGGNGGGGGTGGTSGSVEGGGGGGGAMLNRAGGGGGGNNSSQSFSVNSNNLPLEIKTKSGTTYLRSTRILGKGSFGCVYLGMDAHSGRLVAIKFLPMPSDESGMEDIEAEVLILQRVNDTHVVQLLSYAFEGDTIVIVMECMLAGSLQNMISAFGTIPSSTARVFMRDVLRGLSKIHSMGVIHRDVKPQNVLLSLAGNCKISDFGASAWLQELARKESQGRVCGTPVYLAPEAARGSPAKESDIWSCGIMFLQMITGVLPYPQENLSAGAAVLVFQIGSGIAVPQIPDTLDELDAEFVRACLHVDPSKRLTASALLQMPIFTV